jgi:two-component system sensor histidine kinase HydH
VRELLERAAGLLAARAELHGVRLTVSALPGPVTLEADAGQIQQVLLNLLLNALDVTPPGGEITLEAETAAGAGGPAQTVRVTDTGPGLPPELGARIFEPFVSTKETGLGLGLSVCRRIVEAHGGTITAEDRPEGGAVFIVTLPLRPATRMTNAPPMTHQ